MAYSNTVSRTRFNVNDVIDAAFRRCRVLTQTITAEMQHDAQQNLMLLLSALPNPRVLNWTIEKIVLSMYRGNPVVQMPVGVVKLLDLNYRQLQLQVPESSVADAQTQTLTFAGQVVITTVGAQYAGAYNGDVQVETSDDGVAWTARGFLPSGAVGDFVWFDLIPSVAARYLRLSRAAGLTVNEVQVGNTPQEIPLGPISRDVYNSQPNKVFEGRPSIYWFQRDISQPVINLWPAPNNTSVASAQLIATYQRYVMDVGTLRNDVEVPQRWLDAIVWLLAARVALETPSVPFEVVNFVDGKAAMAKQDAYEGDSDGAPMFVLPMIGAYTR